MRGGHRRRNFGRRRGRSSGHGGFFRLLNPRLIYFTTLKRFQIEGGEILLVVDLRTVLPERPIDMSQFLSKLLIPSRVLPAAV